MINYYNNYNNYLGFSGDNVMWPRGLTRYNYVENPLRGLWNRFGMENVLLISIPETVYYNFMQRKLCGLKLALSLTYCNFV